MIDRSKMMKLILGTCPSFEKPWEDFAWKFQNEEQLPLYIALAEFSKHLVHMWMAGDTDNFSAIFSVIELFYIEGDDYVKEAATMGILDGLQLILIEAKKNLDDFKPYLLAESQKWWDELEAFRTGEIVSVGERMNRPDETS